MTQPVSTRFVTEGTGPNLFLPRWAANTAYSAGFTAVNPSGQIISAKTAFTSGSTYDPTNWNVVSGGSTAPWLAATAYTLGQFATFNGKTIYALAAHTSTSTFDPSKWRVLGTSPSDFHVALYGAVGDGTTNDQAAIQAATDAACAAGTGTIRFDAAVYIVNGSFNTSRHGRALIALPELSTSGTQTANVIFQGVGTVGAAGSTRTGTAGGATATIIKTTVTGQTANATGTPCVIGGPDYDVSGTAFTNIDVRLQNLVVECPQNSTVAGVNFCKALFASADGVVIQTTSVGVLPSNKWAFGIRFPEVTNYDQAQVGRLAVYGFYVGVVANTEHFNALDLVTMYCETGLAITGNNGWHAVSIVKFSAEKTSRCLGFWTVSSGTQPFTSTVWVNIDLLDIEDQAAGGVFAPTFHILDQNNFLKGRINYLRAVSPSGPTTGLTLGGGATNPALVLRDLNAAPVSTGGLLAVNQYAPATAASYTLSTTQTSLVAIDTTNLILTFTAPATGRVVVELTGFPSGSATATADWGLLNASGGAQIGPVTSVTYDLGSTPGQGRGYMTTAPLLVTGLTPGQSYTVQWAWRCGFSSTAGTAQSLNPGSGPGKASATLKVIAA